MTLEQLQDKYATTLPKRAGHWHMLAERVYGQVNAVNSLRGWMVAISDKGLCAIETHLGLEIGHKDWFVKDVVLSEVKPHSGKVRSPKFIEDLSIFDAVK